MKNSIVSKPSRLPYDGRRLLRSLAYAGACRYAVATRAASQSFELSESRLATEYARVLLSAEGDAVRAFTDANKGSMVKKTSKNEELKKAFMDVHASSTHVSSIIVDGIRLGAVSMLERAPSVATVYGTGSYQLEVEAGDAFWTRGSPRRLVVLAFTDWLCDAPGLPWWSAMQPEAWAAMLAAGVGSCTLVGIKADDVPMVRAAALSSDDPRRDLSRFLEPFMEDCRGMAVEACRSGTCRECSDACRVVEVESAGS